MFSAINAWFNANWHEIFLTGMFIWLVSAVHVINENIRLLVQQAVKTNELLWEIKRQRSID